MTEATTLEQLLKFHTVEGELYEKLPDNKVRCYACGHECVIFDGRIGVCKVRFNEGGKLFVPHGYAGALQCDPIEKKPFFHALPGSDALSFGMLGCDYHCSYCFVGTTKVATDLGMVSLAELFEKFQNRVQLDAGEIAFASGIRAVTSQGNYRKINKVFRYSYQGKMVRIKPYYLPEIQATSDHTFFLGRKESPNQLEEVQAKFLRGGDFLIIPKNWPSEESGESDIIQVQNLLQSHQYTLKVPHKLTEFYLVPIKEIQTDLYDGYVYNMEVEDEHTYLAGFFGVKNCQNWITSQTLRDPIAGATPKFVAPEQLVGLALRYKAPVIASTYNEPLITSEWAVEVFKFAKSKGLKTAYISNGNATEEVLDYLRPWVNLYKVDLKGFNDKNYRKLGGKLQTVLDTIQTLHTKGFWLEVVTLVIPGFNDSDEELTQIAQFLVSVSPDIPWHTTAFHQDYKMRDRDNTTAKTLLRATEIGVKNGLRYVYAGNLPGGVDTFENTYCFNCKALLIERYGYQILKNRLQNGSCPKCQTKIPGVWS